jgi:hypothetical protein
MIHEEICTYEVCKLAKKKGFDVPTRTIKVEKIEGTEKEVWDEEECRYITQWETRSVRIPTQSLLQRWLREEKALHIQITLWEKGWYYDIWAFEYYEEEKEYAVKMLYQSPDFSTYELALEDALAYSLKNLV